MSRRVVITGIGLLSPVGIGTEANWQALVAGRSGVGADHQVRPDGVRRADCRRGQGLRPAPVRREEGRQEDRRLHPVRHRRLAVRDGRFRPRRSGPRTPPRVGVFIASGIGGFATIEREHSKLLEGGPGRISPFFIPAAIINLAAGQVSIRFGAKGPNLATCTACAASAHALGDAYRVIRAGRRRRDDRRRLRGRHHADGRRRLRGDAGPVHAQRRAREGQPAVRPRARRLRHRRGSRRAGARGTRVRAGARRPDLRRGRRLRRVGRRVPHHRAVRGRRRRRAGDAGGASRRRRTRRRSTTSTPTARRRRTTTRSRRPPSSGASASTPRRWPSRRPSR